MLALVGCLLAVPSPKEAALAVHPALDPYGRMDPSGKGVDAKPPKDAEPDAVDPHAGDWYPHGEVHEFCQGNIIDRGLTTCCAKACGQCGGSHCANAPGGAKECCHEDIMHGRGDNYCETENQTSCVMPLTCEKDQCLPMCPLHPGCSIIWAKRGLDYSEVRKLKVRQVNVYTGAATQQRDMSLREEQQPQ